MIIIIWTYVLGCPGAGKNGRTLYTALYRLKSKLVDRREYDCGWFVARKKQ